MHASSSWLAAVILTTPFTQALTIPDSAPDPFANVMIPTTPGKAVTTDQVAQQQQQQQNQSENDTIKILVCGDSITQGSEGQFTWRYRLWEWFHINLEYHALTQPQTPSPPSRPDDGEGNNNNTQYYPALQFVGPYNGTLPSSGSIKTTSQNTNTTTMNPDPFHPQAWGPYHPTVHPSFSPDGGSAHFAAWGAPAWLYLDLLHARVAADRPDFVVLHLGFNDIGWWGHEASDLVLTMQRLVFYARVARDDVAVLIADVSHRVAVGGREDIPVKTAEYNRVIREKAREWSTERSPVEVVGVSEVYDCHVESCPGGVDGLHPNSLGEYQIARAYTQIFHERFGFGSGVLEVPEVETIPGMSSHTPGFSDAAVSAITSPPLFVLVGVVLLGLVLATVLRPELLKLRKRYGKGKGRYHLLPSR